MNRADKYKAVKAEITAIYHENKGRYGYRRITTELHKRNFLLNHKTVQQLMKELGLVCRVRMKKYRSYKGEAGKIAPNLLNRDFHAENEKIPDETGLILHSDQGWQYQHRRYQLKQELVEYLDHYNNRRIKAKRKGLPPAIHRQQALSAA